MFAIRIFLFILEDKIEIQLRGHPYNNLANHHYTKCISNQLQNNSEKLDISLSFILMNDFEILYYALTILIIVKKNVQIK